MDRPDTETIEGKALMLEGEGDNDSAFSIGIMNLPDEILENIFARISPYNDLDNIRLVCKRFYCVSKSEWYLV